MVKPVMLLVMSVPFLRLMARMASWFWSVPVGSVPEVQLAASRVQRSSVLPSVVSVPS